MISLALCNAPKEGRDLQKYVAVVVTAPGSFRLITSSWNVRLPALRWPLVLLGVSLGVFSAVSPEAAAFAPTPVTELALLGTGHVTITENAILRVLASDYGITAPSASTRAAIDTIKSGNSFTDEDQFRSSKHFDGENFVGGHEQIIFERNQVLEFTRSGNMFLARFSLGEACHPLQDFYSHSSWLENGNGAPNAMLTNPGTTQDQLLAAFQQWRAMQAGPDDATCGSCNAAVELQPSCPDCRSNLTSSRLTSGYYGGEDRQPRAGVAKCTHGGLLDSSAPAWPGEPFLSPLPFRYGMNKDGNNCRFSPHNHLHDTAASVATNATEAFLRALKAELTDAEFRQLLGIGPSFNLTLDTTSSMEPVIDGVRDSVHTLLEERAGTGETPTQLVMVELNDPAVGPARTTSDPAAFEATLASLEVRGGGDCREPAMDALFQTVSAAEDGSSVILYTNGSTKDAEQADAVTALANAKGISVYPSLFGSCSPYDPAFFKVAEQTGGQVFALDPAEATNVGAVLSATARTNSARLLAKNFDLSSTLNQSEFLVDSTISQLSVSISAEIAEPPATGVPDAGVRLEELLQATLLAPDGSSVSAATPGASVVELSTGRVITLTTPAAGRWSLQLSGSGRVSVAVVAETPRQLFGVEFSELRGRAGHQGLFPIRSMPVTGVETDVVVRMSPDARAARLLLQTFAGDPLGEYDLTRLEDPEGASPSTTYFHARVTPPAGQFRALVLAEDASQVPFQRLFPRGFSGQYLALAFAPTFPVLPGSTATHDITLTNQGAADNFHISVSEELDFLDMPRTQELALGAGESRVFSLRVDVPDDAPPFQGNTITVSIVSDANPASNTFAVVQLEVLRTLEVDDDLIPQQIDNCPDTENTEQVDTDGDGVGDACETDADGDRRDDTEDNCPIDANRDQKDSDKDGLGDACDPDPNCACRVPGAPRPSAGWALGLALLVGLAGLRRLRRRRQKAE